MVKKFTVSTRCINTCLQNKKKSFLNQLVFDQKIDNREFTKEFMVQLQTFTTSDYLLKKKLR